MLYVNASPESVSDDQWAEWFVSQHLPTLSTAKTCERVLLYKEIGFAMLPESDHPLHFLALYESPYDGLQNGHAYKSASEEEESDIRNYKMIQDYNPRDANDGKTRNKITMRSFEAKCRHLLDPSPTILTTEMNPLDTNDFEDWYRTDLLPRIGRLSGHRRSRRYQLSAGCENSYETFLGRDYLAIHEFDDLNKAFRSERQHRDNLTARAEKHIQESEATGGFIRRGWELVHARSFAQ